MRVPQCQRWWCGQVLRAWPRKALGSMGELLRVGQGCGSSQIVGESRSLGKGSYLALMLTTRPCIRRGWAECSLSSQNSGPAGSFLHLPPPTPTLTLKAADSEVNLGRSGCVPPLNPALPLQQHPVAMMLAINRHIDAAFHLSVTLVSPSHGRMVGLMESGAPESDAMTNSRLDSQETKKVRAI